MPAPETLETPEAKRPVTVFYDGACPLCAWEIRQYATQDTNQNLCFVDVSTEIEALPPSLDRGLALRRLHVMTDGGLQSGAAAFTAIWRVLPGWRHVAAIARLPLVLPVLEAGYRAFLLVRPFVSRTARLFANPRSARP